MKPSIPALAALSLIPFAAPAAAGETQTKIPAPLVHQGDVKLPPSALAGAITAPPSAPIAAPNASHAPDADPDAQHAAALAKALAHPRTTDTIDRSQVAWDAPGDGAWWARGRNWKASFGTDGVAFIPFFGSDAPRNFPLHLALARVSRGGAPLPLAGTTLARSADGVDLEHGTLHERWHATPDSLEQTFVFDALPGTGELVLELSASSELEPSAESGGGFRFANALGSVHYGAATAIDAHGARLALASELVDGALRLRVPAAFLAEAALPLTIDPLLYANAVSTLPTVELLPDIASDGINLRYLVAFEEVYSATDTDVYTTSTTLDGLPIANTGVYVDYTTDAWFAPKVAFNALHQTFLTTCQVRPFGSSDPIIRGRARAALSTTLYAQQTISGAEPGHKFYVDVGGDPELTGPTYFFAAWTRNFSANDWDIHARLIDFDGTPLGTSAIYLENSSGTFDWHPRVSKTDGRAPFPSQAWNVTWMRSQPSGNIDILGAQVRWDGLIVTPTFGLTSGFVAVYPTVSSPLDATAYGASRPYAIAWHTGAATDHDTFLAVLQGTQLGAPAVNLPQLEGSDMTQDQVYPEVDTDGSRFAIAYLESYAHSTVDFDGYAATAFFTPGTIQVLEGHQNFDFSGQATDTARVSGFFSAAAQPYFPYFGLAWNRTSSNNNTDGDIYAGSYLAPDTLTTFCAGDGSYGNCPCSNNLGSAYAGCPNSVNAIGASLYSSGGSAYVSNDTLVLNALGMPTTSTCIFLQGTQTAAPGTLFGDGLRCVGGTLIRLGTKAVSGGGTSYPQAGDATVSVRGQVPATGGWRYYQAWYRNPDPTFCTAATSNVSNGMGVLWLP